MADFCTLFSCRLEVGTSSNGERALALYEEMNRAPDDADGMTLGFHVVADPTTVGSLLIRDADGRFIHDGRADGPLFLSRLRKGLYTVTTHWDAWSFLRPVKIDKERGRVVFETTRLGII